MELRLKKGKEASLLRRHRWIFSGAIQSDTKGLKEGDLVDVVSSSGKFLARGYYNPGSIAVKILTFDEVEITERWFYTQFEKAIALRSTVGLTNTSETNCYRLVHAEGDGIPGLIVDYYDQHIVLQIHSKAIYHFRSEILSALSRLFPELKTLFIKTPEKSGVILEKGAEWLSGNDQSTLIKENGIKFIAHWAEGQKTGFFLDQRDNRKLLMHYSRGRSVLNTFCYTGGFSVYALKGEAAHVDSIDYSQWAMDALNENLRLNEIHERHHGITGDALKYLTAMDKSYDLIVLDPPAFAKSVSARHNAIQAYKRINQLAIKKIGSGGIIFTFSCSQVVDTYTFQQTVLSAAIEAGREVKILHHLSQPADHPVSVFHPESSYLKGLVLYVD